MIVIIMSKIKYLLVGVLMALTLQTANAYLYITNSFYDPIEDSFTVQVKTNEPWVVWRTFDFVNWDPVSLINPASRFEYTDIDVDEQFAYYMVMPPYTYPRIVGFELPKKHQRGQKITGKPSRKHLRP